MLSFVAGACYLFEIGNFKLSSNPLFEMVKKPLNCKKQNDAFA